MIPHGQEHNFYKLNCFLNQKITILLQFEDLICLCSLFKFVPFFHLLIVDLQCTAIFMGKWLILYDRSV